MEKHQAKDRPKTESAPKKRNVSAGSGGIAGGKHLGQEVGSMVVFAASLFLLVSLITYHPNDPSLFTASSVTRTFNACGKVGAYLSSLIFQFVGIAGFMVPAALFFISASLYKREGGLRFAGTLSGMTVSVFALTVFLTLQWKTWSYAGSTLLTGGALGVWFAEILLKQFNHLGSSIISLLAFAISLALSTPISVAQVGGKILGVASQALLKVSRVLVTYLGFLLGLLAMKAAQAGAKGMERAIEAALAKAKAVRERKRLTLVPKPESDEESDEDVVPLAQSPKKLPVLTSGDEPAEDSAKEKTAKRERSKLTVLPAVVETSAAKLGESAVPLAANVLPELEDASRGKVSGGMIPALSTAQQVRAEMNLSSIPAILPHEHQKQSDLGLGMRIGANDDVADKKPKKTKLPSKRGNWKLPTIDFLVKPPKVESQVDKERLYQNAEILRQKFLDFEIEGEVTAVRPGPVITLYEFKPAAGVKVSRIASLADDISMALSAQSVRIIAPLPGKSVVGIEIPSETRENVFMREFMNHVDFAGGKHQLPVAMGKDIAGNTYIADLAKTPHLLAAGQTGSGKSVFMNGLICSLLYRFTPDELRLILVDPKMIEFVSYQDIPHLLLPVVDDTAQASSALKWAVREMERRYRILAMMNMRNLAAYNTRVDEIGAEILQETLEQAESQIEGLEKMSGGDWLEAFEKDDDGDHQFGKLPYIVIVIDELADLMMVAKKEVEVSIARIAQKARAAGIHLVIATQRPSTDVVTGIIKANLPSRVSFQLASGIDSKTILDRFGAERLLGRGDMFFIPPGTSNLLRLHGAYLSDDEINKVTGFLRDQGKPNYRNEILVDEDAESMEEQEGDMSDPMLDRAVELVKQSGHASASYLQRHLRVGYNRAARMIELMEARGIVGPADGARPREVLLR